LSHYGKYFAFYGNMLDNTVHVDYWSYHHDRGRLKKEAVGIVIWDAKLRQSALSDPHSGERGSDAGRIPLDVRNDGIM
jgi:hypothetical protein